MTTDPTALRALAAVDRLNRALAVYEERDAAGRVTSYEHELVGAWNDLVASGYVAALADRNARIEAALDLHAPMKIWESDRIYTLACRGCKLEPHPCQTAQALSVPAVPVPQDNPEATRAYLAQPTMCAWCRQPAVVYAWVNGEWVCEPCQHVRPKNGEKP